MTELPIIARAIEHAQRIAIRSATGAFAYRELVGGSATIAATLLEGRGDLEETRVAFLLPPGEQYVQAQWGIWRAGGIAVPL